MSNSLNGGDTDDERSVRSTRSTQDSVNRSHRYEVPERVHILYDGTRSFWRTRCRLDIIVAHHEYAKTIELICYDPCLGLEAPRIYMNVDILKARVDRFEMNQRMTARKESNLRQKIYMRAADIAHEVMDEMMLSFIFTRMDVHMADETMKHFRVALTPQEGDEIVTVKMDDYSGSGKYTTAPHSSALNPSATAPNVPRRRHSRDGGASAAEPALDCVVARPLGLTPLVVNNRQTASLGEMATALNLLRNDNMALQEATYVAGLALTSTKGFQNMLTEKRAVLTQRITKARWRRAVHRVIVRLAVTRVRRRLLDGTSAISDWYRNLLKHQRRSSRKISNAWLGGGGGVSTQNSKDNYHQSRRSSTEKPPLVARNGNYPESIVELSQSQQKAVEREERIQQARQTREDARRKRRTYDNGADGGTSDAESKSTSRFFNMVKASPNDRSKRGDKGEDERPSSLRVAGGPQGGLFPSPEKERPATADARTQSHSRRSSNTSTGSGTNSVDNGLTNASTAANPTSSATGSLPKISKAKMGPSLRDIKGVFFGSSQSTQPRQRRTDEELRAMRSRRPSTGATQEKSENIVEEVTDENTATPVVDTAPVVTDSKKEASSKRNNIQSKDNGEATNPFIAKKDGWATSHHHGEAKHRNHNHHASHIHKHHDKGKKLPKVEDEEEPKPGRGHFWDLGQQLQTESMQNKYVKLHENSNLARDDPYFKEENKKHRTLFPAGSPRMDNSVTAASIANVCSIDYDDDDSIGVRSTHERQYGHSQHSTPNKVAQYHSSSHLPPTHPAAYNSPAHPAASPYIQFGGANASTPSRAYSPSPQGRHSDLTHHKTAGRASPALQGRSTLSVSSVEDDDDDATVELGWQPDQPRGAPSLMNSYANSMMHLEQNVPINSFASVQLSLQKFDRSGKHKSGNKKKGRA